MTGSSFMAGMPMPARRTAAVAIGLILIFIFSATAGLTPASRAAQVAPTGGTAASDNPGASLKAVIIVGPTHDLTASNLKRGETLAQLAESYGMDVRRVFHPNATWDNVLANIQGANLVAYLGHGNGWPSPYGPFQERTKNGFGLNPFEGAGRNNVEYQGANRIRNSIVLASNAVVLLNHLCYSSGNGEEGMSIPSWSVAHQRVDNFAAGFHFAGAGAVFAYRSQSVGVVIQQLMTTDRTMERIFTTTGTKAHPAYGYVGWDPRQLDSERTPGTVNFLDPAAKQGFERAVSGHLSMTAADFRNGGEPVTSPPSGGESNSTADTTAPTTPSNLATESLGYRRISLTWKASTDDRPGPIEYRIFRNNTRIAKVSDVTSFVDRPTAGTHRYKIRAVDSAGNKSAFSVVVEGQAIKGELTGLLAPDTTAPTTPSNLATEWLGYRRISLTWTASTDDRPGPIEYRIFRNNTRIAKVSDVTSFVDRPKAGTHRYKIRAVDSAGNKSAFSAVVEGHAKKGPLPD